MKWLDSIAPVAPKDLTLRYGEGKIILNWTRSGQAADGEYAGQYAIYRFSQAENVDIKNFQNIVHISAKDVNKFEDIFSIDPSQSYTYIITALDRLHNESIGTCRATIESRLTSLKDEYQSNIIVYPNPANGKLYINFRELPTFPSQITMINTYGQVVKIIEPNTKIMEVDIDDIRSGIYFLNVDKVLNYRVVVY